MKVFLSHSNDGKNNKVKVSLKTNEKKKKKFRKDGEVRRGKKFFRD